MQSMKSGEICCVSSPFLASQEFSELGKSRCMVEHDHSMVVHADQSNLKLDIARRMYITATQCDLRMHSLTRAHTQMVPTGLAVGAVSMRTTPTFQQVCTQFDHCKY